MADTDHITTAGKSPAFQFYPKDFLSDENVRLMSMQERGVYITLMCLCWIEGTLPADVSLLARLAGVPLSAFRKLWPQLLPCFRTDAARDGRLIHPRLEKELVKQALFRRRQGDNGRRGGRPIKPTAKPQPEIVETQNNPGLSAAGFPKKSSAFAISDLRSASSDSSQNATRSPRAIQTGGVMAGSLPRDHANCRPPCVRVCISEKQFGLFVQNHGGSEYEAEAFVTDWLVRKRAGFPAGPIGGEKPWAMWERLWNADFPSAAALAGQGKTAGNLGNLQRFAAKGRA